MCWSKTVCYEIRLLLLLCPPAGPDAGIWSCASSLAAQAANSHEFLWVEAAASHGLGEEFALFKWQKPQRFGIENPQSFLLVDMKKEPDIPGANWILVRSCTRSCRVATKLCLLRFCAVFYACHSSILMFCFSIQRNLLELSPRCWHQINSRSPHKDYSWAGAKLAGTGASRKVWI